MLFYLQSNITVILIQQLTVILIFIKFSTIVKPFNLATLKANNFTYKIILAPFILVNSNHTHQHSMNFV